MDAIEMKLPAWTWIRIWWCQRRQKEQQSQVGGGSNPKPRQKGYQYPKIFCKSWQISLVMQSHAMCPPLESTNTKQKCGIGQRESHNKLRWFRIF